MSRKRLKMLNEQISYEERKRLIKESRELISAVAENVKRLGHWPDSVEFALSGITKIIKNIETANEREERRRKAQ